MTPFWRLWGPRPAKLLAPATLRDMAVLAQTNLERSVGKTAEFVSKKMDKDDKFEKPTKCQVHNLF